MSEKMKKLRLNSQARKAFQGSSRGFSLIEVVIAIALIGIIAVAVLSALSTASIVLIIADKRATAESLARSQMEYVKNQGYIDYSKELSAPEREPDFYGQIPIPSEVGDYTLETKAEPINASNTTDITTNPNTPPHQPYPKKIGSPDVYQKDDGIQKITVIVSYDGKAVITLEDYKIGSVT